MTVPSKYVYLLYCICLETYDVTSIAEMIVLVSYQLCSISNQVIELTRISNIHAHHDMVNVCTFYTPVLL